MSGEFSEPVAEYHKSCNTNLMVASIRHIDVSEICDAYTASEIRAISRYLNNIAEHLDYLNSRTGTGSLFEIRNTVV